ncbi:aspartyl-tRNA ligase [Candidatus Mycoplasma haematolamae str. Purdue]|uniref:Aspartyl-tRNA ligase n=1 Tax=Mycoplasma haematolamae (strain Purdue) TaxID=1212765 RepID=I7CEM9_MYCHA|nr:amino acid--tRNA ligase-related protein [Candidatus Mycoplasma haematolamae]AFO51701.1 aspartyl-tRNA ligase [Candidatus Mycoplasma haematolamae str. Purdue]
MISRKIPICEVRFHDTKQVVIGGFVERIRKLKNLTFLIIRDSSGTIQVVLPRDDEEELPTRESVVLVKGISTRKLDSEDFEVAGKEVQVLSWAKPVPIELEVDKESEERFRMRYKYLDLRRQDVKRNLVFSSKAKYLVSSLLNSMKFVEVSTPLLSFPSKEGANTFSTEKNNVAPKGFVLAQSPQLYKQLLMIGGFEAYFQFATSFRAERLREDRQFEFTQLDIEMSMTTREKLFEIIEEMMCLICKKLLGKPLAYSTFPKLTYKEAVWKYGSDKPDVRFPCTIFNLFEGLPRQSFWPEDLCLCILYETERELYLPEIFEYAGKKYSYIRKDPNGEYTGKCEAWMIEYVKGLEKQSSFYLFYLYSGELQRESKSLELGKLRTVLAKTDTLRDWDNHNAFVWIVDWPYFEVSDEGKLQPVHHPFTKPIIPKGLEEANYLSWGSHGYDLVLNGSEIASGGIRVTDAQLQEKILRVLGYSDEEIDKSFGWFLEALSYGVPPHLGIAIGWERLMKELLSLRSIREVIAFPKNSHGSCSMSTGKSWA